MNETTVCDCCGEALDVAEANFDAFGYGTVCNECYAELLWERENEAGDGDEEE